jgi:hypothetical protein
VIKSLCESGKENVRCVNVMKKNKRSTESDIEAHMADDRNTSK